MAKRESSAIRVEGDVAYISLTRGYEAVIDVDDIPLVEGYPWHVVISHGKHVYAARTPDRKKLPMLMHRVILDAPKGILVDHRDNYGLNNRRSNIRLATQSLNNANMAPSSRNKLGIKGVTQEKSGHFSAKIQIAGQSTFIGTFFTAEEASAAYYGAARILFGDFAKR